MKIIVVGKGLAGHGVIESLVRKIGNNEIECLWLGPEMSLDNQKAWGPCSLNSTALVSLHGIQKGVSPLGNLLTDSFYATKKFLETHNAEGVEKCYRLHLGTNGKEEEKIFNRFGSLESLTLKERTFSGFKEEAFQIHPINFFKWWDNRLSQICHFKLRKDSQLALSLDSEKKLIRTQSGIEPFDKLIIATGALGLDLKLKRECRLKQKSEGKKVVGHFFRKELERPYQLGEKSFIVTLDGQNLIYNASEKLLTLGGSNQGDGPIAPDLEAIKKQQELFIKTFPEWHQELKFRSDHLYTGVRYKAPRRMPFARLYNNDIGEVNGFYKNGWTLTHFLSDSLISEILK